MFGKGRERGSETHDKLEKAQRACTHRALQGEMEEIHLLKDLLREGDWMTKVDLKNRYFTETNINILMCSDINFRNGRA